jgi:hypothetical protein
MGKFYEVRGAHLRGGGRAPPEGQTDSRPGASYSSLGHRRGCRLTLILASTRRACSIHGGLPITPFHVSRSVRDGL